MTASSQAGSPVFGTDQAPSASGKRVKWNCHGAEQRLGKSCSVPCRSAEVLEGVDVVELVEGVEGVEGEGFHFGKHHSRHNCALLYPLPFPHSTFYELL